MTVLVQTKGHDTPNSPNHYLVTVVFAVAVLECVDRQNNQHIGIAALSLSFSFILMLTHQVAQIVLRGFGCCEGLGVRSDMVVQVFDKEGKPVLCNKALKDVIEYDRRVMRARLIR